MNETSLTLLMESISNLSGRISAIECAFIDYIESEPSKSSSQWTEERLRALEYQVKSMKDNDD